MATHKATRVLVSTGWLHHQLAAKNAAIKVIDATFHMPAWNRDALAEFEASHIPTATFFDVDQIKDESSSLPHMLPPANVFQEAMRDRGIKNTDHVVVYDCSDFGGLFSAPRMWWMLRVFGHNRVSVLNGGFALWKRQNLPVESGKLQLPVVDRSDYTVPEENKEFIRTRQDILDNLEQAHELVLDARAKGRFDGTAPEPREGLSSGHIPGSLNIPFTDFVNDDKQCKTTEEVVEVFKERGVDPSKRAVASCGSGITACAISFAAHIATATEHDAEDDQADGDDAAHVPRARNHDKVMPVYDGSWVEWASTGCPIANNTSQ